MGILITRDIRAFHGGGGVSISIISSRAIPVGKDHKTLDDKKQHCIIIDNLLKHYKAKHE
jgi:hypothetical protein